jgi:gamma-glutamyltranspeptidase/glutathione hydrolase
MQILSNTDIASRGPSDPQSWYLFAEASRLMYADRDAYVGDPAFVRVPAAGLIDPTYAAARARLIGPAAGPPPAAGVPAGAKVAANENTVEPTGTSHFIVRDAAGNVVSMTTTVESLFGTGRIVDGFFLNNQLTDFSFSPVDEQGSSSRQCRRSGQAPALIDGPDDQPRQDGVRRRIVGGRQCYHRLCRQEHRASVDWKNRCPRPWPNRISSHADPTFRRGHGNFRRRSSKD